MIHPTDNGFTEVLAIVASADASAKRHCDALGYSRIWEGPADKAMLAQLGLPDDEGAEVLIGDPAQGRGFIRLLELKGRDEGLMRDGAQTWDVGGIFDINIRSLGPLEKLNRAMQKAGHVAFAPLTAWDFGALSVKEVVLRDTDGLAIAMMERVAPPLTGYEHVAGNTSYVFNSTQIVHDFDAARRLFVDGLGWKIVTESEMALETGHNCMGLPLDLARERKIRIGIYQQNGKNEGSIELISVACEGMDFTASRPPLRGWASLRFPVSDVAAELAKAEAAGAEIVGQSEMTIEPYGKVELGSAITPWGARLDFYRPL